MFIHVTVSIMHVNTYIAGVSISIMPVTGITTFVGVSTLLTKDLTALVTDTSTKLVTRISHCEYPASNKAYNAVQYLLAEM